MAQDDKPCSFVRSWRWSSVELQLFVAEGFDGVELCGLHGGPDAEDEADADADDDAEDRGPNGYTAGPFESQANEQHKTIHKDEGDEASQPCQRHGFEQKLPGDVLAFCADGFADTDLAGAFGNTDEHDVHHADPADEQADGAEENRGDRDFADDVAKFLDLFFGGVDGEIVVGVLGAVVAG